MIYKAKKRTKLLIYRPKWKIHFAICFVHKMKRFSLFRLTFGCKRSHDSVTGGSIFTNLVSKYPQDFKEKKSWISAAESRCGFTCVTNFVWGEPLSPPPPPPPPGQLGLKVHRSTCRIKQISQNLVETMNKFLIFLKLNAWYTVNVLETVEHS